MSFYEPEIRSSDPSTVGWDSDYNGVQWFNSSTGERKYWYNNNIYICATIEPSSIPPSSFDFESGWEYSYGSDVLDNGRWSGTINSPDVTGSVKNSGNYALTTSNVTNYIYKQFYGIVDCYARAYIRLTSMPTIDNQEFVIMRLSKASETTIFTNLVLGRYSSVNKWNVQYYNNGMYNDNRSTLYSPSSNTWYCVELNYKCGNGDGEVHCYIDGNELTDVGHIGLQSNYTAGSERFGIGNLWSAYSTTIYIDDVAINDSYIGTI